MRILNNPEMRTDTREKELRNIMVGIDESWYHLGAKAIKEIRKKRKEGDAPRKVRFSDIETFLRATVFCP